MPWFKVDDAFAFHPKVIAAGNAAAGLWVRAGSWASQQLTDGHIPTEIARTLGRPAEIQRLVNAGLWMKNGDGWDFHEWSTHNPTRAEVTANRASDVRRQALSRDVSLREFIRTRDGDLCRYCGTQVAWQDRRGPTGGTYDHIDPRGSNTADNLVVACRRCNSAKGHRTPAEAGMRLLPPGGRSHDAASNGART